jgi:hypothetical protein
MIDQIYKYKQYRKYGVACVLLHKFSEYIPGDEIVEKHYLETSFVRRKLFGYVLGKFAYELLDE